MIPKWSYVNYIDYEDEPQIVLELKTAEQVNFFNFKNDHVLDFVVQSRLIGYPFVEMFLNGIYILRFEFDFDVLPILYDIKNLGGILCNIESVEGYEYESDFTALISDISKDRLNDMINRFQFLVTYGGMWLLEEDNIWA